MKSIFRAMTLVVAAAALFLLVGAASMATAGSKAKVTISVASLRPGSSDEAKKQFNDNVALFERQHPNIDVKPTEYAWNGATFATQLAAGRLPTVFTVPFTDARTLGEHRQVADITAADQEVAVLQEVPEDGHRGGHDGEGPNHRRPLCRLCTGAALQPRPVQAGRSQSEQAADDLGAGA